MSTQLSPALGEPGAPDTPETAETPPSSPHHRRVLWIVLAVAAVVAAVAAFLVVRSNDDGSTTASTSTTATTATTAPSTSAPTSTVPTTATTPATVPLDLTTAVYPTEQSGITYTEPVAAAKGFADFLGFTDPVVGEFLAGDSRSGEVEVRPSAGGPATTVFVRQLGSGGDWYVLGSATTNIVVTAPEALQTITSPVHLTGTSTAFEGTVNVKLYADGQTTPLAQTTFMGGSNGDMGPFDATLDFPAPPTLDGSLVFSTQSMADGGTNEASVLRVHFGP